MLLYRVNTWNKICKHSDKITIAYFKASCSDAVSPLSENDDVERLKERLYFKRVRFKIALL